MCAMERNTDTHRSPGQPHDLKSLGSILASGKKARRQREIVYCFWKDQPGELWFLPHITDDASFQLSCSFAWTFFWATFVAFSLLASGFNFVHFETCSFLSHLIFLAASVLLWPAVGTYPSLCLRSCTAATSSALVLPYYLSEYKHVAATF